MKTKITLLVAVLATIVVAFTGCGEFKKGFKKGFERSKKAAQKQKEAENPLPKDTPSLKALAEEGDAKAEYWLGYNYSIGFGTPKDSEEALKWYRKAAEQGHADAQNVLGHAYKRGKGVEQNYTEALQWYLKSAEQGNRLAQFWLGEIFKEGQGVAKDDVVALAWYRIAAINKHAVAKRLNPMFEKKLTPEQLAKTDELVKKMTKENPKLIMTPEQLAQAHETAMEKMRRARDGLKGKKE